MDRYSDDEVISTKIARNMIIGKVFNSKWVIERATRDYAMRLDIVKLKNATGILQNSLELISETENLDQLRGYEGEAAIKDRHLIMLMLCHPLFTHFWLVMLELHLKL